MEPTLPSTPCARIGVLIVDDHEVVRTGIARLIACADLPLRELRLAANAAEALGAAAQMQPDVIVLDVDLAGEDGLALIPRFDARAAVLVLSSHGDTRTRTRARSLGARAFVEKHSPASVLLESIRRIGDLRMRGEEGPVHSGPSSHGTL